MPRTQRSNRAPKDSAAEFARHHQIITEHRAQAEQAGEEACRAMWIVGVHILLLWGGLFRAGGYGDLADWFARGLCMSEANARRYRRAGTLREQDVAGYRFTLEGLEEQSRTPQVLRGVLGGLTLQGTMTTAQLRRAREAGMACLAQTGDVAAAAAAMEEAALSARKRQEPGFLALAQKLDAQLDRVEERIEELAAQAGTEEERQWVARLRARLAGGEAADFAAADPPAPTDQADARASDPPAPAGPADKASDPPAPAGPAAPARPAPPTPAATPPRSPAPPPTPQRPRPPEPPPDPTALVRQQALADGWTASSLTRLESLAGGADALFTDDDDDDGMPPDDPEPLPVLDTRRAVYPPIVREAMAPAQDQRPLRGKGAIDYHKESGMPDDFVFDDYTLGYNTDGY